MITRSNFRECLDAKKHSGFCLQCNRETAHVLLWRKSGLGLGIPLISWFTDKTVISIGKKYVLECQDCLQMVQVDKAAAESLIT
jgi:hypothetical protein